MKRMAVALDCASDIANLGLCVASRRGFYRSVGLEVIFTSALGNQASAQTVACGNSNLAVTSVKGALLCASRRTLHRLDQELTAVAALPSQPSRDDKVLVAGPHLLTADSHLRLFLAATALGFREAIADPHGAAHDMTRLFGLSLRHELQLQHECHELAAEERAEWGHMDRAHWSAATRALTSSGRVPSATAEMQWTNEYLPGLLSGAMFSMDQPRSEAEAKHKRGGQTLAGADPPHLKMHVRGDYSAL